MQLGMIGVGRMGGNMVQRLLGGGHTCIVVDRDQEAVERAVEHGAVAAESIADLVAKLDAPRTVWVMVRHTDTEAVLKSLREVLEPGDTVIDGGNSHFRDDVRRAGEFSKLGIYYLDVGTSGGVRGLTRGYCLMIGGDREAVKGLDPIFKTLAPGRAAASVTPGREGGSSTAEDGYLYCGPSGAGHFVKMVHNLIEYAVALAFGEGFHLLAAASEEGTEDKDFRYDFDLPEIAEVWRRGSVVVAWLLDLLSEAFAEDPELSSYRGPVGESGEGRWAVEAAVQEGVPTIAGAAALFSRFRSQHGDTMADWVVSAMRAKFGGHTTG